MVNVPFLVESALEAQDPNLTQLFRTAAISKGWPISIANKINLNLTLDGLSYAIPKDIQEEVDLLEYGDATQKLPPKAVIQTFEARVAEQLEQDVAEFLDKGLAVILFKEFMSR